MTEEERIQKINTKAAVCLEEWMQKIEDEEVTEDDLLASVYGQMVAAYLLGYNLEAMLKDAKAGGDRLLEVFEESEQLENNDNPVVVCKNKDESGNCQLHNLHCQYPDCEKNS